MKRALILVDLQPDFMPGGPLAVPGGDQTLPMANRLLDRRDLYSLTVATQDWHPAEHLSFAVNHPGKALYDAIELRGRPQTLWPVHCMQNTPGAEIHPALDRSKIDAVVRKGQDVEVDSYSGFLDNDRQTSTGLADLLRQHQITHLDVCGLAGDYCVAATALDALELGFQVHLLAFATFSVNLQPEDEQRAFAQVEAAGGVVLMNEEELATTSP